MSHFIGHGCPNVSVGISQLPSDSFPISSVNEVAIVLELGTYVGLLTISCGGLLMWLNKTWTPILLSIPFPLNGHLNTLQHVILEPFANIFYTIGSKKYAFVGILLSALSIPRGLGETT